MSTVAEPQETQSIALDPTEVPSIGEAVVYFNRATDTKPWPAQVADRGGSHTTLDLVTFQAIRIIRPKSVYYRHDAYWESHPEQKSKMPCWDFVEAYKQEANAQRQADAERRKAVLEDQNLHRIADLWNNNFNRGYIMQVMNLTSAMLGQHLSRCKSKNMLSRHWEPGLKD